MAKSDKPVIWGVFAAGGSLTAFVIPALVVVTLLAALGHPPAGLDYASLRAAAGHWLGKLVIFAVLCLSFWSSAHRLRITCFDFGLRADGWVAAVVYLTAAAGTLATAVLLTQL